MNVIKFGGSSISSAKNIENVIEIIKCYKSNLVVVLSAFGETTDNLIKCGKLASIRDKEYKKVFKSISNNHIEICKELFELKKNYSELFDKNIYFTN